MKTTVHDYFQLNPPTIAYSKDGARSLKSAFRHSDQTISQSSTRPGRSLLGAKEEHYPVTGRYEKDPQPGQDEIQENGGSLMWMVDILEYVFC
jgi:hypothetical protein